MDRLWWNHITKAHKFMEDIVHTAVEGKSILLSLPENVPWRNTLLELVEDQLKLENPKNSFEIISCPEEEAGLYLLNQFCPEERRSSYRYGMTYASFLGQCEDTVLNDRYLWITDIPETKYDEWMNFIIEYNKNVTNKTPAIFILEINKESFVHSAKKGLKKMIFSQNIGAYDQFAFCALAATENSCKDYLRPYLAELVATLCRDDMELCAECVRMGSRFLEDPIRVIHQIKEEKYRSDGNAYCFSKNNEEIKTFIWETQLKHVFPAIEKYRSHFIKKYYAAIQSALPISSSYGELVDKPEDVEIGTLLYLAANGRIPVNTNEYQELELYRNSRNKLAHLNILESDAVELILSARAY